MKTIVFIEDEAALQKTFGDMLEQEGYEVFLAGDGKQGLDLVTTKKPDLILLDLVLPTMHGFDVLREIKKDAETARIPVIVLTNLEAMADIQKALELGATTYLVKSSYQMEGVLEKVREAIGA